MGLKSGSCLSDSSQPLPYAIASINAVTLSLSDLMAITHSKLSIHWHFLSNSVCDSDNTELQPTTCCWCGISTSQVPC